MSQRFQNFIDYYLSEINTVIFEYINEKEYTAEHASKALIEKRRKIPEMLSFFDLPKDYLKVQDKEKLVKQIQTDLNSIYDNDIFKEIDQNEFIDTLFFNQTQITFKDVNKYGKKLKEYNINKSLNSLYKLSFSKFDNSRYVNEGDRLDFKTALRDTFELVKDSDKAEYFSKLNIFFEEYLKTPVGEKRLEIMYQNFSNNPDKKQAMRDWTMDLLNTVNQCTPNRDDLELDSDGKLKRGTAEGGIFDALYFIRKYNINSQQQKELESINNLEELNRFDKKFDSVAQIQISATADKSVDIESNSVFRHSLANIVISTTLNNYYKKVRQEGFIDSFSTKEKGNSLYNANILGSIIEAFETEHPELLKNIKVDKAESPEKFFIALQKSLTKNPEKYIEDKLVQDGSIPLKDRKVKKLEIEDMEKYLSYNKEESYARSVFEPQNYFSVYYEYGIRKKLGHIDHEKINQLNDLSMPEIAISMQYSALVKQSVTDDLKISLEAAQLFFEENFEVRGIARNFEIRNNRLNELSINEIDRFVLNNFILSEHSIDNNDFLDKARLRNFSKIVEGLSRDDFNTLQEEYPKELLLEGILKLKDEKCFSNDSELTIMALIKEKVQRIESENKLSKAEEEVLLSKYKYSIYTMKEDLLEGDEPNINRDYGKLYKLIQKDKLELDTLENNNEMLKSFLESHGIDWRTDNPKKEINKAYNRIESENFELPQNVNSSYENNQLIENRKQKQKENREDEAFKDGGRKKQKRMKNR